MKLLVRMKRHMNEDVPQDLLDQIAAEEARLAAEEQKKLALQEERKAAFKSTFSDLSKEISKLVAEQKQKTAEEQALLDRFANVLTRIDEIKAAQPAEDIVPEVTEDQPEEVVQPIVEEVVPQPEVIEEKAAILAPIEEPTLAKEAAKKIKKKDQPPSMFVQPEPEVTSRDLKEIQRKLQLMEGWVSKISMAGPGGGAVWLRDLDDVARSSVLGATDGQVLKFNATTKRWEAGDVTVTGNVGTLHQVTTAGNTTNNSITANGVHSTHFAANLTAGYSVSTGEIAWNPADLTFDMGMASGVVLQVGQEQYIKVKAAANITNGMAVMFAGVDGEHILAAHNDMHSVGYRPEFFIGVATHNITHNGFGYITTFGKVHNINTLAWTSGDILFADPTVVGGLTNVEPEDINIMVAAVTKRAGGDGHIMVRPSWRPYLDDLNGVNITAPANGHVLMYIASSNTWVNHSIDGFQTTAGLSANVATLTSNNTLYLGGVAANQYISTTADWVLDSVGISFPNGAGIQTVPFVGDADLLGGIAADQYAYANAIPSIAGLQTTAGLSANVAKLSANNTLFLGGIAANQYAYANAVPSIAGLQTTAGLSANVATLSSNNSLYLGGVAANQYAHANGSNFNIINPLTVTYTGATATGYALILNASNTQGGATYADFLKVTNKSAGATANSKSFRLTSSGGLEIINSAYTASIFGLSDAGDLAVSGKIQVNGKQAVNGPAFSAYAAAILQTIPSDAQTKVLFQTEEFDTANCYTNSRFTPNVEGYYQLNAEVRLDGTSGTGEMMIVLFRNGSEYKRGTNQSGTQIAANFWAMQVSSMVYANGSTDYFEVYVQQGSGASRTVTAVNNPAITWFNGCMLRGA